MNDSQAADLCTSHLQARNCQKAEMRVVGNIICCNNPVSRVTCEF